MAIFNYFKKLWIASGFNLTLLILIGLPVYGADFTSPRVAALGGSGHAGPLLNDSIFLNPSYASFLPTYGIGANYLFFDAESKPGAPVGTTGRNFSFSIQDGRSELFQAGLAYTKREDLTFVHIGASKAAIKQLGFGLGWKIILPGNGRNVAHDATFSTTYLVSNWLQTALIIDNLLESKVSRAHNMYREVIFGTKFNVMGITLLYFDPHWFPDAPGISSYGHELGVEFTLMKDLFLRLGNFKNAKVGYQGVYGNGYGAGLGWIAPRISLDYGISRMLRPWSSTAHVFGATVYF